MTNLPLRAIDRGGAARTADDGVVRILALTPLPALAGEPEELAPLRRALATLHDAPAAGEALQWYVEARPLGLEELLLPPPASGRRPHDALLQLAAADAERLAAGAPDPPAVERAVHLVIRTAARGPAALERSLERADAVRATLAAAGLSARLLDGPGISRLLLRRLGVHAPDAEQPCVEVAGAQAPWDERRRTAVAAARLLERVQETIDFGDERHVLVGESLEQTVSVSGLPPGETFDLLATLRPVRLPSALSVHVRAGEHGGLSIAACLAIRAPGPEPGAVRLATVVDEVVRDAAASGVRVTRGEFLQQALWHSTLPLAIAPATVVEHPADAATAAATAPLASDDCGSPGGVPFARGAQGRLERLDPWDVVHRHAGVLVAGGDAAARAQAALPALVRLAARGTAVAIVDGERALAHAAGALGDAAERVAARGPIELLRRVPGERAGRRLLVVDAEPGADLLPIAGAAAAALHEAAGVLDGNLADEAPPALGVLAITAAERLLAEPGAAAWLRLLAGTARRHGCALILLAQSVHAVAQAGLLDALPVRILLPCGPLEAASAAALLGLPPAEAYALTGEPQAAGPAAALWLNGARGHARVGLLELAA